MARPHPVEQALLKPPTRFRGRFGTGPRHLEMGGGGGKALPAASIPCTSFPPLHVATGAPGGKQTQDARPPPSPPPAFSRGSGSHPHLPGLISMRLLSSPEGLYFPWGRNAALTSCPTSSCFVTLVLPHSSFLGVTEREKLSVANPIKMLSLMPPLKAPFSKVRSEQSFFSALDAHGVTQRL